MSDYTPTTEEIIRSYAIPPGVVSPQREGESFADWLGRISIEGHGHQLESEAAARRWLAQYTAEKRAEWEAEQSEVEFMVLDGSGDFWALTSSRLEADHYALQEPGATIQQRHCTPWLPVPDTTNHESEGKA